MFASARRLRLLPLLVLLLCLLVPGALADTEGNYTYSIVETGAVIEGYTGTAANVTVPGTLGGYPVVKMGFGCLQSNAYAVTITLPDSLRELNGGAFMGCSSLTAVYLPANLTTFTECGETNFIYVVGRSTATARLMTNAAGRYPSYRFIDPDWPDYKLCYFTHEATGPAELGIAQYIGSGTVVTVPDGVVRIGQSAFANTSNNSICGKLTSVTLPESVTAIDSYAFSGTDALKTLTLSSNISS
ncbi:MAG: leucine-rich repeat domain-containing protein, partial [Candidatus Ventricola sp.]